MKRYSLFYSVKLVFMCKIAARGTQTKRMLIQRLCFSQPEHKLIFRYRSYYHTVIHPSKELTMNALNKRHISFCLFTLFFLTACGANKDPTAQIINVALEPDIEEFYTDSTTLYPGESLSIEWTSSEAFIFDMKLYVSSDRSLSSNDPILIEERCGIESNDYCAVLVNNIFVCDFESDNSFDCWHDSDLLKQNDLGEFFDQLPKDAHLILELCNHNLCQLSTRSITFQ